MFIAYLHLIEKSPLFVPFKLGRYVRASCYYSKPYNLE